MSILSKQSTGSGSSRGYDVQTHGPTGTFPARVVDVAETFGVEIPSFEDPTKMVVRDVCRFLVAYRDTDGNVHLVQSWEMTQSPNEKSSLYKFLTALKGSAPVFDGSYDFCDEVGGTCQVTVASKTSRKGTNYNFISAIAPLMADSEDKAPKMSEANVPGGARSDIAQNTEQPSADADNNDNNPF